MPPSALACVSTRPATDSPPPRARLANRRLHGLDLTLSYDRPEDLHAHLLAVRQSVVRILGREEAEPRPLAPFLEALDMRLRTLEGELRAGLDTGRRGAQAAARGGGS